MIVSNRLIILSLNEYQYHKSICKLVTYRVPVTRDWLMKRDPGKGILIQLNPKLPPPPVTPGSIRICIMFYPRVNPDWQVTLPCMRNERSANQSGLGCCQPWTERNSIRTIRMGTTKCSYVYKRIICGSIRIGKMWTLNTSQLEAGSTSIGTEWYLPESRPIRESIRIGKLRPLNANELEAGWIRIGELRSI